MFLSYAEILSFHSRHTDCTVNYFTVLPFVCLQNPTGDLVLQQAITHRHPSGIVFQWLDEQCTDVKWLLWITRLSDLKSIEYISDVIEKDIRASDHPSLNLLKLWEILNGSWMHVPSEGVQGLVESMKRRSAAAIRTEDDVITRQVSLIQLLFSVNKYNLCNKKDITHISHIRLKIFFT